MADPSSGDGAPGCLELDLCSDDNRIKVVCRVRPPVSREMHGASLNSANRCLSVGEDKRTVILHSKPQDKSFTFDYAAGENSTQEEIFEEVGRPVTEACLEGYNGTIFCYGQTGSGKTFTTFGPGVVMGNHLSLSDPKLHLQRGLVPRVLEYLYGSIARKVRDRDGQLKYSCRCSFYEIFNERVFDLVDESNRDSITGLSVREDHKKGVYVEGLAEEQVENAEEACEILLTGFRNRHVGETAMNRESSRSHAVFTLVIEATDINREKGITHSRMARFNLVDLAGSERQKDTRASGERLKEASSINKSLSTLGQVINALVERSAGRFRHIHYRDSKLTFLLRDSLGGNSKTMLVAALSPAGSNIGETLSTLQFAQRAKMIKNQAVKNEDTSGSYDALLKEVTTLRMRLAGTHSMGPHRALTPPHNGYGDGDNSPGAHHDCHASEAILVDALRRARAAESAVCREKLRTDCLLSTVDRHEKEDMQLKMVIKFRDRTIAAQRKGDADQEKATMSEELAHLTKQLEAKVQESSEASMWRTKFKEAEAELVQLNEAGPSNTNSSLAWGHPDEERFRREMDEKVVSMVGEIEHLREEVCGLEGRLECEAKAAEKRRKSAANRAELEGKKLVEDALLRKLQDALGKSDEKQEALDAIEAKAKGLESRNTELEAVTASLTKQLEDSNRQAVEDRDARLATLQVKIEELSLEKDRVVKDSGSEVGAVTAKLATALKDNRILLGRARDLDDEAEGLEKQVLALETERAETATKNETEKAEATAAMSDLEQRIRQQQETYEREVEEFAAEKSALHADLHTLRDRLATAEEVHRLAIEQQQHLMSNLQGKLSEAHTREGELESGLKILREDYDTLTQQEQYNRGRADDLEEALKQAQEDRQRAIAAGVARACMAQCSVLGVQRSLVSVEKELAKAEDKINLTEISVLGREVEAKGHEVSRLTQNVESLERQLEDVSGHLTAAGEALAAKNVESEQLKQEVERVRCELVGAQCSLATTEKALGTEKAETVRQAEELEDVGCQLKAVQGSLAATEQALGTEKAKAAQQAEELEAVRCELVSAETTRQAEELEAVKYELVAVQGSLAATEKTLGTEKAETARQAEELKTVGNQLVSVQDSLAATEKSLETEKAEVAKQVVELESLGKRLVATTGDLASATEELSKRTKELAAARVEKESKDAALGTCQTELSSSKDALCVVNEKLVRCEEELRNASTDAALQKKELTAMRKKLTLAEKKLLTATARSAELEGKLDAVGEELAAVESERTANGAALVEREAELLASSAGLKDARKEVTMLKKELASVEKSLAATVKKLDKATNELSVAERRVLEEEGHVQAVTEELEESKGELRAVEKRLVQAEEEMRVESERRATAEVSTEASEKKATGFKEQLDDVKVEVRMDLPLSLDVPFCFISASIKVKKENGALQTEIGETLKMKSELDCRVSQLEEEEEREAKEEELALMERRMVEAQQELESVRARQTLAKEELEVAKEEARNATEKAEMLQDTNVSLASHKNQRQKIQQVQRLKDELNSLTRSNKDLCDQALVLKR
ncbi:unnamed protein product, partial [Choristocarpus tenellus]